MDGPARHWICTQSCELGADFETIFNAGGIAELRGQRERGDGGFEHYQFVVSLLKPQRRSWLLHRFGAGGHWEPTRSDAARAYCWKADTRIPESQFAYGAQLMRRSNATDWKGKYLISNPLRPKLLSRARRVGDWMQLEMRPRTFTFVVTTSYPELLVTFSNLWQLNALHLSFGEQPVLEKAVWPGNGPEQMVYNLTLKTLPQNGGVAIAVMNTLYWMNFEVRSESLIYYVGWTDTQLQWKPKGELVPSWDTLSGSRQTWIPEIGIQM